MNNLYDVYSYCYFLQKKMRVLKKINKFAPSDTYKLIFYLY